MDDKLVIRKATTEDATAIHHVFTESIAQISPAFYTEEQKAAWAEAISHDSWTTTMVELHFYVALSQTTEQQPEEGLNGGINVNIVGFVSWYGREIVHVYSLRIGESSSSRDGRVLGKDCHEGNLIRGVARGDLVARRRGEKDSEAPVSKGTGTQLMTFALESMGPGEVTLTSSLNAEGFYERFGFVSQERIVKERGGIEIPCIRMRRASHSLS